ncbi:MAG: OmpH family outer membrane protein [Flavobacteriales bacterium]
MKKLIVIAAVALLGFTTAANAQKYGHINAQELLIAVPGYEDSNKEMERYREGKVKDLQDMQRVLKERYDEYVAKKSTLSKAIQESREKEITELQTNVGQFEQSAQTKIQKKQQELMEPLLNNLQDAIKAVGKANGYAYIFDITQGTVVYFDGGDDLTQLVIAELKKGASTTTATPMK